MKLSLILFGCLSFGAAGFYYFQGNSPKKLAELTAQNEAVSQSKLELAELKNELNSIKNEAIVVRENHSQLQLNAQQLNAENKRLTDESKKLKVDSDQRDLMKQRAMCILNQRNLQAAVRGHENIEGLQVGDPINWQEIVGPGKFIHEMPVCACGVPYVLVNVIPPVGQLVATCKQAGQGGKHTPPKFSDW